MDYVGGWAGVNPDPEKVRTSSICSLVMWPQVGYLWIYRDKEIAADLAEEGIEDMISHFLPRNKLWLKDGFTWSMHRGGREVYSWTNYILVTDSRLFQNVAVRDARQNTYYYLVLGCLHRAAPSAPLPYLGNCTPFPIRPPVTPDKVDRMFSELWRFIPSLPGGNATVRPVSHLRPRF